MSDQNLASQHNAGLINQRFKELETDILALRERQEFLENSIGTLNGLIQAQTAMIQKLWVQQHGTGAV